MNDIRTVTDLLAVQEPIIRGWIAEQIGDHAASNNPGDQFEFEFSGLADGDTIYYDGSAYEWKNTSQLQIDPSNSIVTVSSGVLYIDDGNAANAALITTDYSIISAQGSAPGLSIIAASSDHVDHRGVFKAVRARGTLGTPLVPLSGDTVFSLLGAIYDGVDTEGTARIDFIVDGDVSSDVCPQRISFTTSSTTAANRVERIQIKSSGDILINDVGSPIDFLIKGDTDATLFQTDGGLDVVAMGGAVDASYKLKVHGATAIDGDLTFIGAQQIVTSAGALTLNPATDVITADDVKLYSGADLIVYSDAGSTEVGRWDGATGNILTLGSVGIGTNTPGSKVVITDSDFTPDSLVGSNHPSNITAYIGSNIGGDTTTANAELLIGHITDGNTVGDILGQVAFWSSDGSTNATGRQAVIKAISESGSGQNAGLAFFTGTGAAATEVVRVANYGFVGIGITAPLAKLHIDQSNPSMGAYPVLILDQADVSEQCIEFSSDSTDRDINLFTVDVTGTPKMWWDESEDMFALTKPLTITSSGSIESTLHPVQTSTATSGSHYNIYALSNVSPGGASSASYYAARFLSTTQTNQNITGEVWGAWYQVSHGQASTVAALGSDSIDVGNTSSGTITNCYGVYDIVKNTSTGTITNAFGAYIQLRNDHADGTIGAGYGISIRQPNKTAGTITTCYGLHIGDQDQGGTNYAIYTGLGANRFGDYMTIVQDSTTGAQPVLALDQDDVSEEFIRFTGSAAAGVLTQSIVDEGDQASEALEGWLKVYVVDEGDQITDQAYYIPIYTLSA